MDLLCKTTNSTHQQQHTVYHIVCLTEKRNDNACTVFYTMVFDGRKNLKFDWTDNFINNTTKIYTLNIK